ncbi:MAG: hypothetical protein RL196_1280 [Actinomycetota bacterium]|jgi:peptidoglycan/LPS O-acetylase OafA/YrhL
MRFRLGDALRGIAAIGVVALHTKVPLPLVSANYLMVDFFFVLSGVVLSKFFYPDTSSLHTTAFVAKRAARFFPLTVAGLLVSLVIVAFENQIADTPAEITLWSVVPSFLMMQIFVSIAPFAMGPLWSLAAEWWVNVVLFWPVRRFGRPMLWALLAAGTLLITIGMLTNESASAYYVGFSAFGRALAGFCAGLLISRFKPVKKSTISLVAISLCVMLMYWLGTFSWIALILAAYLFAALLMVVKNFDPKYSQSRFARFGDWLGSLSFGIYVWHAVFQVSTRWIIVRAFHLDETSDSFHFAWFVALLLISIGAAQLSKVYLEKPITQWVNARLSRADKAVA